MAIYLRVSQKTREARRLLESIEKPKGKELLKKFLNNELKNKLISKTSAQSVITYVEKSNDSNITEFAKLLQYGENRKKFKKAVKCQAKSTGTKKNGLFYKLIYQNGNLNMESLNKSKIKAFLLAKKDTDIIEDIDYMGEKDEGEIKNEDKKSRRMKNEDIIEKLKSGRLSNILKVFMALVLWKYLKLLTSGYIVAESSDDEEKQAKGKTSKYDLKEMAENIEIIYAYFPSEKNLSEKQILKLVSFKSYFDRHLKYKNLDSDYFEKIISKYSKKELNEIYNNIEELLPIVSKPVVGKLSGYAKKTATISDRDLVKDLRNYYEKDFDSEGYEGRLDRQIKGFREIVNSAKRKDIDIDLSFNDSFFNQKFEAPYRKLNKEEIGKEWGVNTNMTPGLYEKGKLEDKLKEIINKWYPNCILKDYSNGERNIVDFIFNDNRFEDLINGKKDSFSPELFVKILYSFEKEAKRLKIKPEDFNGPHPLKKERMTDEQKKLNNFWYMTKLAFSSGTNGCCVQFQRMVDIIAQHYDEYENSIKSKSNGPEYLGDRKFCQMLRDQAASQAVTKCERCADGGASAVDYARLIRSIFTPLVSASDAGYHSEGGLGEIGETYESLAIKWKDAVSSFDLIKDIFDEVYPVMTEDEKKNNIENMGNESIKLEKFISIVKSIGKKRKNKCKREMESIYELLEKDIKESSDDIVAADDEAVNRIGRMRKWIYQNGDFTINEFIKLISEDAFGVIDDIKKFKTYKSIIENMNVIKYIIHLDKSGLVNIDG